MAYFGGTATDRPWPRIDRTAAFLFLVFITALGAYVMVGSPGLQQKQPEKVIVIKEVEVPAKPTSSMILVARENIWPGQRLKPEMLTLEERPIIGLDDKALRSMDDVRGAYTITSVAANSPLLKEHISYTPPANILTARIPEGHRAVAIPVNAETGVEGWARPGARVDVVWTSTHRERMVVSTIVENAQVLSAERSTEAMPQGQAATPPVVNFITLLVTTRDAQKIQLAKASGSLSLNLRGDLDSESAGGGTLTVESLLKRSDREALEDVQGSVQMNGKQYVIRGGKMVPASEIAATE